MMLDEGREGPLRWWQTGDWAERLNPAGSTAQPLRPVAVGGTFEARHEVAANSGFQGTAFSGNVHGSDADRLRHPSRGGRNAHDAVALSRRSLERAGGEPGHRRSRSHELSAWYAALRPRRLAAGPWQARQRFGDGPARGIRPAW